MITEVKHKLLFKAIDKYNLLNSHMRSDTDGAPSCPDAAAPAGGPGEVELGEGEGKKLEEEYIKQYPECPMAFD